MGFSGGETRWYINILWTFYGKWIGLICTIVHIFWGWMFMNNRWIQGYQGFNPSFLPRHLISSNWLFAIDLEVTVARMRYYKKKMRSLFGLIWYVLMYWFWMVLVFIMITTVKFTVTYDDDDDHDISWWCDPSWVWCPGWSCFTAQAPLKYQSHPTGHKQLTSYPHGFYKPGYRIRLKSCVFWWILCWLQYSAGCNPSANSWASHIPSHKPFTKHSLLSAPRHKFLQFHPSIDAWCIHPQQFHYRLTHLLLILTHNI